MATVYNRVAFDYGSPVATGYQVVEDGYETRLTDDDGNDVALEVEHGLHVTDADIPAPSWAA